MSAKDQIEKWLKLIICKWFSKTLCNWESLNEPLKFNFQRIHILLHFCSFGIKITKMLFIEWMENGDSFELLVELYLISALPSSFKRKRKRNSFILLFQKKEKWILKSQWVAKISDFKFFWVKSYGSLLDLKTNQSSETKLLLQDCTAMILKVLGMCLLHLLALLL